MFLFFRAFPFYYLVNSLYVSFYYLVFFKLSNIFSLGFLVSVYVTLVSCIIVCFEDISPPIRLTTGLGFGYLTILGHLISTAHWPHYCILLRILGQCFDWLLFVHLVYLIMLSFVNMFYFYDHQLCAGVITCVAVYIV